MSDVADRPDTPARSGARAFARLDTSMIGTRRPVRPVAEPMAKATPANDAAPVAAFEPAPQIETVTLNKIGDFLELDFGRLFTWLRRGMLLGLILAAIGGVAGGIYAMVATPKYTVSTDILIDPANLQALPDDIYQQPGQIDNALLNAGSKLRVLTSGNVLARVVDELNLVDDKEFYDPNPGFSLGSLIPGSAEKEAADPKLAALASLTKKITAKKQVSRIEYNVFEGFGCVGAPKTVISRGKIAWAEGDLRAKAGDGDFVAREPNAPVHVANAIWKGIRQPKGVKRVEVTP